MEIHYAGIRNAGLAALVTGCLAWQAIAARRSVGRPTWKKQHELASIALYVLLSVYGAAALLLIDSWPRIGGLPFLVIGLRQSVDAIRSYNRLDSPESGGYIDSPGE